MSAARRLQPARRLIAAALLALLFTQWAALVHSVVHAPVGSVPAVVHAPVRGMHAEVHAPGGEAQAVEVHEHAPAFGHAAGSAACELLDHLLIGQATASGQDELAQPTGDCRPLLPAQRVAESRPPGLPPARGPPQA